MREEKQHGPITRAFRFLFIDESYGRNSISGFGFATAIAAGFVALIASIVVVVGVWNEKGCGQRGDAYGLEADYGWWAETCFATLPDGRTVNIENVRENSRGVTIYTPDLEAR